MRRENSYGSNRNNCPENNKWLAFKGKINRANFSYKYLVANIAIFALAYMTPALLQGLDTYKLIGFLICFILLCTLIVGLELRRMRDGGLDGMVILTVLLLRMFAPKLIMNVTGWMSIPVNGIAVYLCITIAFAAFYLYLPSKYPSRN